MRTIRHLLIVTVCFMGPWLVAQPSFSAVFQKSSLPHMSLNGGSWEELVQKNDRLRTEGFELIDLEVIPAAGAVSFWGVWRKSDQPANIHRAESWEELISLKQANESEGLMLVDLESFLSEEGQQYFVGIWKEGDTPHQVWKHDSWETMKQHTRTLSGKFLQLVDIEAIPLEWGGVTFLGVFHRDSPSRRAHLMLTTDGEKFNNDRYQRSRSGYPIQDIEIYESNGATYFLGMYKKEDTERDAKHQLDYKSLMAHQEFLGEGYKLVDIEISQSAGRVLAPPFQINRLKDTPNISGGEEGEVPATRMSHSDYTATYAAANGLLWLASNGYPQLNPYTDKDLLEAQEMVTRKLSERFANKSNQSLNAHAVIEGVTQYIKGQGYQIDRIGVQNVRKVDREAFSQSVINQLLQVEAQLEHPTLEFVSKGLVGKSIVLIQWGLYEKAPQDSLNQRFRKVGTRWGTVVGHGINENQAKDPNVLITHSPAHGDRGPLYLHVEDLDSQIPIHPDAKLLDPEDTYNPTVSALGKKQLRNALRAKGQRFAVWEQSVIISLKETVLAQAGFLYQE